MRIRKKLNNFDKVEQQIKMDTRRLKSSFYKKCFGPFVFASDQNRFRVLTLPPHELQQEMISFRHANVMFSVFKGVIFKSGLI